MKISELINLTEEDIRRGYVESKNKGIIDRYLNQDCIIAYNKARFGCIFVIKIKGGYACFYYMDRKLAYVFYGYTILRRFSLNDFIELMEGEGTIVNLEEYSKLKKYLIYQAI
jgi:hypothetical protein